MGQTQSENMFVTTIQPFVGEIDHRQIKKKEFVGKGTFGTVYKAVWKDQTVAVKYIEQEQNGITFTIEVALLSRVLHPNIVRLYGVYTQKPHVCLVMELAEGGSLYNLLHCTRHMYTIGHAMNWARQCAEGVAHLHAMTPRPVIHRDLKSLNLLVVNAGTVIKICDFGTATEKRTLMSLDKGTIAYMAPEVFKGNKYTEKCDVYSWGIVLWELVSRQQPYKEIDQQYAIMYSVGNGNRPQLITKCPKPIENLMTTCWDENADNRPSMSDIVDQIVKLCEYFSFGYFHQSLENFVNPPRGNYENPIVREIDHREINQFSLVGKGTFGKVYKAMWKNQYVAVKYINQSRSFTRIDHPNIVRLFGVCTQKPNVCLVMELCDEISLYNVFKLKVEYSTAHAISWMKQCAEAVAFLHSMIPKPFLYQNLIPTNLFLFNKGTLLKIGPVDTKARAFRYMSPEVFRAMDYTEKSDVYRWGKTFLDVIQQPQRQPYLVYGPAPDELVTTIKKLITTCCDKNPANRPLMHEIVETVRDLYHDYDDNDEVFEEFVIPLRIPYKHEWQHYQNHHNKIQQKSIIDYVSYLSERLDEIMPKNRVNHCKITETNQDDPVKLLHDYRVTVIKLISIIIPVINGLSKRKSERNKLISSLIPFSSDGEILFYSKLSRKVAREEEEEEKNNIIDLYQYKKPVINRTSYMTESFEEFIHFLTHGNCIITDANQNDLVLLLYKYRRILNEQSSEIQLLINQYSEINTKLDEMLTTISFVKSHLELQHADKVEDVIKL